MGMASVTQHLPPLPSRARSLTCGSGARGAHGLAIHVCLHVRRGVGVIAPAVHRRAGGQHARVGGGLAGYWGLRGQSRVRCGAALGLRVSACPQASPPPKGTDGTTRPWRPSSPRGGRQEATGAGEAQWGHSPAQSPL